MISNADATYFAKFFQEQTLARVERLRKREMPRKKGEFLLNLSVKVTSTTQPRRLCATASEDGAEKRGWK